MNDNTQYSQNVQSQDNYFADSHQADASLAQQSQNQFHSQNEFQNQSPQGLHPSVDDAPNTSAKLTEYELEMLRKMPPIPHLSISAFCIDSNTAVSIEKSAEDRRMEKASLNVEMGGIPAAIERFATSVTPNLLIVECNDPPETLLHQLEKLADLCEERTSVLVIGNYNDVGLYRELINKGVSDYIVSPVTSVQMLDFIAGLYGSKNNDKLGRISTFIGAKGGIGTSTLIHNVAWTIAELFNEKTALIDFDLGFGSASLNLNKDAIQSVFDALQAPDRFDEVLFDRLLTKCSNNLSLFASPVSLEHDYDYNGSNFSPVFDVARNNVPYTLIDLPHTWNSWIKKCLLLTDDIYIVTSPDLAGLRNARNLKERIVSLRENDAPPRLIICPVGIPKKPEVPSDDIAKALDMEIDHVIQFDPENFGKASNEGMMMYELNAKMEINTIFYNIAMQIVGKKNLVSKEGEKSFLSFIESLINFR